MLQIYAFMLKQLLFYYMDKDIVHKSYLIAGQRMTAIWSGNFLVFHSKLGGQLVRHRKYYLFCFVLVLQLCI